MAEVQGYAGNVKSEKDRPGGESEVDFTRQKLTGTMSVIVRRVRHRKPDPERTGEFGGVVRFGSDQARDKPDMPDKPDEPGKPDEPDVIPWCKSDESVLNTSDLEIHQQSGGVEVEIHKVVTLGYKLVEIRKKAGGWWIISPGKNRKRMESSANAGVDRKFMRRNGVSPRTYVIISVGLECSKVAGMERIKAGGERRWTDDSEFPQDVRPIRPGRMAMLVQYNPELGSPSDIELEVGTICRKSRKGVGWGISTVSSASDESAKVFGVEMIGNERKMTSVSPL
ncbi:hypothetical protein K438DRAFT_1761684 [Mycena galopus ATCC 62051]|nr:hypothetical protein K438DRAFT_1761684 [Mycena galopus ATCC 62051]